MYEESRHSSVQIEHSFCHFSINVYPSFMTVVILWGKYH